jgi:polygalacturonase
VNVRRREFLRFAAAGLVEVGASANWACRADPRAPFNVRAFGAVADGKALDTSAVNRTIAAAAAAGGGTVHFPAGAYAGQPTGRIKCGTESNGGFKNVTVKDCVFESCRGFALETVDGGPIEDITFTGLSPCATSAMRRSFSGSARACGHPPERARARCGG